MCQQNSCRQNISSPKRLHHGEATDFSHKKVQMKLRKLITILCSRLKYQQKVQNQNITFKIKKTNSGPPLQIGLSVSGFIYRFTFWKLNPNSSVTLGSTWVRCPWNCSVLTHAIDKYFQLNFLRLTPTIQHPFALPCNYNDQFCIPLKKYWLL